MTPVLIPNQHEGNPLYPLPADYDSLTHDGQRQARVNACRQWQLPGTPSVRAEAAVASLWYFDTYYLHPDAEHEFDPLFYDQMPLPTPDFHWDLSRMWAMSPLSVALAPRGSAKSTHVKRTTLLELVTAPAWSCVYATSNHDNSKHVGQALKDQSYENARINDDFGAEVGSGRLKPSRGVRPTGTEYFFLNNGSWLRCISAESRMRGLRPRVFALDDPEYDEKAATSMQQTRDYMDRLLFRLALPMVMRARCGIRWVGTFVSKRHYLWHAMMVKDTPQGPRAVDPRFDWWARLWIRAAIEDPETGLLTSCWPEMWPTTEEEKRTRNLTDRISLEQMKAIMGSVSFNNEMLGRPGTSEEQFFKLDTRIDGRHSYWLDRLDPTFDTDPWQSEATINWRNHDDTLGSARLCDWLPSVRLFMTVDTAFTEKSTSDRRCCTLMAVDKENRLFVLDIWSDRRGDGDLIKRALTICARWRCPSIHVEVVKESFKLYKRFQQVINTKLTQEMGFLAFVPGVRDIRPGLISKTDKIATLDVRFEHSLIKLPVWRRNEVPAVTRLIDQVESFNPEAADGALEKDDELDCWPKGTPVLTKRGWVPIQDVTTSDHVLTGAGWKRVLENVNTGAQEVITRFGITATPHHPIWTLNRGYVELDSLEMTDTLVVCQETQAPSTKTSPEKLSGSTGLPSTAGPGVEEKTTSGTSGLTAKSDHLNPSIARSGSSTTDPSPEVTPSTTGTATPSTTPRKISSAFPAGSTPESPLMKVSWPTSEDRRRDPIWRGFVRSHLNGTAPLRDGHGILKTLMTSVSEVPSLPAGLDFATLPASDAAVHIRPFLGSPTSGVPRSASARQIEKRSPGIDGKSVSHGRLPTWCLRVEDVHQFFGGHVLGSNTVSMSLFVLRAKPRHATPAHTPDLTNPIEAIKAGNFYMPDGTSIGSGIPLQFLDSETVGSILANSRLREAQLTADRGPTRV